MVQAAVGSQAIIVKQKGCGNTKAGVDFSICRFYSVGFNCSEQNDK
jgi:hypothetical protein